MLQIFIILLSILTFSTFANDFENETEDLLEACVKGNIKSARHHLENGASVNARANSGRTPGRTPIMWAAARGKKELVKLLIDHGAEVNAKDDWKGNMTKPDGTEGWTALLFAADSDHEEVVKILIEKGADVNIKTKSGITALGLAHLWKNEEMIKMLKQAGARE
ncbi:MAG TPA: ankyrin repeat domain-containing protein [Leptospiraceae bacterium]|nr:ankyrin repeat domain-containing protein [Leptospiraceae bacterium]HMW04959.1 ankyrin repeat domain-containing protein [Leptospiraceae bacterium]HMX31892.1 ankyrin repeat domain-containing protein [Leptospiraceae bacterium]HMY30820.1 ankyrin repeat domain-containing protein [Leptospiraceae bacterium]HMZ64281.1 ankyrin repeat domain-containing protein [Leptospiraceae bacterium]